MKTRKKNREAGDRELQKTGPEQKTTDRKAYSKPSIEEMDVRLNPVMFAPSATSC